MDYYNEFDPRAAAWLRVLIAEGLIPEGDVDERSIVDVRGDELTRYRRCHFFAGVGGWAEALRLAGWPEDRPVWTGSCPCQPFSVAGKNKGVADKRHLWPDFRRLIAECNPPIVLGEQVASKAGRGWLAGVRTDLEALAYAVGAADLCAAGAGAPHIRQRLWWGAADRLADTRGRRREQCNAGIGAIQQPDPDGDLCGVADTGYRTVSEWPREAGRQGVQRASERDGLGEDRAARRLGDTDQPGPQGRGEHAGEHAGERAARETGEPRRRFWDDFSVVHCTDGKTRRFESRSFPLAHGASARVGRLRGYGNAIVPQIAAEFIGAFMESL